MRTATGPDGTRIAFTSNRDGDFEVWVMNADGTNPINLTHNTPAHCLHVPREANRCERCLRFRSQNRRTLLLEDEPAFRAGMVPAEPRPAEAEAVSS
jgi:hypothetical protein